MALCLLQLHLCLHTRAALTRKKHAAASVVTPPTVCTPLQIGSGKNYTEVQVDELLTSRRAAQPGFVEPSFPTIAGGLMSSCMVASAWGVRIMHLMCRPIRYLHGTGPCCLGKNLHGALMLSQLPCVAAA